MTEERDWLGELAAASQAAAERNMGTPIHGVDGRVVGYEYDITQPGAVDAALDHARREAERLTADGGLAEFIAKRADMDKVRDWYERAEAAQAEVNEIIAAAEGPETGHTFCITVDIRPSSNVVGEPKTDGPAFGEYGSVTVRAWDLRAALEKAASLPLTEWMGEDDDG